MSDTLYTNPCGPLIINCCLTGMRPVRTDNAHVPVSPGEIIDDALAVVEAGASMLHIHACDDNGLPTWRPEPYRRIIEGIRVARPETVIVATTSGRRFSTLEQRSAVLDLGGDARPDMASLTLGSMNFSDGASLNSPEVIQALARLMRERGIQPELEVFDLGMLNYGLYLVKKGLLEAPAYINLLLGSLGAAPGRVLDLALLAREVPADWIWAGAGIGVHQLSINTAAIAMGGHVRVGLEDNVYLDRARRQPADNVALVKRVVRIAAELDRPIETATSTRQRLGLRACHPVV